MRAWPSVLLLVFSVIASSGCAIAGLYGIGFMLHGPPPFLGGTTPQQNFIDIHALHVGQSIKEYREKPAEVVDWDAGTEEWHYRCCHPDCRYSYVVDKQTSTILALRHTRTCAITP